MIGIFDSGSGGLTVLKAIRERLPSSDIVYFGDIKNAPYGDKSSGELGALTVRAIELLQEQGAESIVSACNSVSASLAVSLVDALALGPGQLIEMVGPTVSALKGAPERLLLVATPATIRSEIYQNAFRMIGTNVMAVAIPDLAAAIEFGKGEEEEERLIRAALKGVSLADFDLLILACTHYPLAAAAFSRATRLPLIAPAEAVADRVKKRLWPREVGEGTTRFLVSADTPQFRERLAVLGLGSAPVEVIE